MRYSLILLLFTYVWGGSRIDIDTILSQLYPHPVSITKKSALIPKNKIAPIQQKARVKLRSKLFRYFIIKHNGTKDVAILLPQKVRTKKAAYLYVIHNGSIKHIEVIAFSEPPEYKPTRKWLTQFQNKSLQDNLDVSDGIAASSGATLSAKSAAHGAKLALAIYEEILKEKL